MQSGIAPDTPSANEAFRRVYDNHYADILAYCLRRASREDAYDATADVFLVAWRRLADLPSGEKTLPWLYVTARRVLANQRRGRSRLTRLTKRLASNPRSGPPGPEALVLRRDQDQQVLDALRRLRLPDREVIRLTVWEDLPQATVGEVLGCSDRAVTMRLQRAVRRLGRELRHTQPRRAISTALAPDSEATNE